MQVVFVRSHNLLGNLAAPAMDTSSIVYVGIRYRRGGEKVHNLAQVVRDRKVFAAPLNRGGKTKGLKYCSVALEDKVVVVYIAYWRRLRRGTLVRRH